MHLECDDFEAEVMRKEPNSDEYVSVRMVPPGRLRYYFSVNEEVRIAIEQPKTANIPRKVLDRREIKVPMTNILENIVQSRRLVNHMVLEEMCAKPRPDPYKVPVRERPETPWRRSKSCFKNYKEDTPVISRL